MVKRTNPHSSISQRDGGEAEESSCVSLAQRGRRLEMISLNLFESDQSWATGKPEVRGVQLALKGDGLHGVRSAGGRAEGQRGGGVVSRMGEGI